MFAFVFILLVLLMLGMFFTGCRMVGGAKPDVNVFGAEVWWNPLNLVWKPSLLTEEGMLFRRWYLRCVAAFVVLLVGFVVVEIVLQQK